MDNLTTPNKYKELLTNVYKAADYLGEKADSLARDFSRDNTLRSKDQGLCAAYANIKQMIVSHDTIGRVDHWSANNVKDDLPLILK